MRIYSMRLNLKRYSFLCHLSIKVKIINYIPIAILQKKYCQFFWSDKCTSIQFLGPREANKGF